MSNSLATTGQRKDCERGLLELRTTGALAKPEQAGVVDQLILCLSAER
jgi:hypothetical protein